MKTTAEHHAELLREKCRSDPVWAHDRYFRRRHEDTTPEFHRDLIEALWSADDRLVLLSFRGSGKSTRSEEAVALWACLGLFKNCLLIGSSETRAAERIAAVSNELKMNDELIHTFGNMVAEPWTQTKLVLTSGACIQCMGRDQDIRGIKHLDARPDLIVVDDFEDKESVQSPEGRRKTLRWFLAELLPACDPKRRVRVLATPMDQESVPMLLIRTPRPAWPHRIFPIERLDPLFGDREAMWPARFPLHWIDAERSDYESLGEADVWSREYMCEAVAESSRTFRADMIRIEPIAHTFQSRWAMIDPARTVRRTSSATGWAVWSWERHRLVVWDAGAKLLMPDEIVDLAFKLANDYGVVELGIEENGLHEWLAQPIRARMSQAGAIPYRGVLAPRGKLDFCRGLQPFFAAGEVVFARDLPDLRDQLLGFPTGRLDTVNALAYALLLRPGRLVYEGWRPEAQIRPVTLGREPLYLALNATRIELAAALCQLVDGRLQIAADWIFEGDPGETVERALREASMRCGRGFTAICGPAHFDEYQNVGLVQQLRLAGCEVRPGTHHEKGREWLRRELGRSLGGDPVLAAGEDASWTARAFAGGFSRGLDGGSPSPEPADNRYRLLMEGIESLAGLVSWGLEDDAAPQNWAFDRQGRRYLSAFPGRANPAERTLQ